jgi:hypothetical protein
MTERAELLPIYERSLGGRVVISSMTEAERSYAVASEPWRWSLSPRLFAQWPDYQVRGAPVYPASLADTMKQK